MLYALLRSSVRHWSDTEANWVHIQSRLGLKATAPPVKISSYFCVNISPSGPTVRADVRWLDGDAAVHGFHGLSFSSKQELCYQRASVLFLSCSWRSKRRFCMMAKILKKKGGSCANTGSSSEPAVFSGVNVRSVVNRHISALRMCCSSTTCVEKKWIFPFVIVRKLSKKFSQEKLRLCSSSASGPS